MTERPLFNVDPGESDTATKRDKERNVDKSIKIAKSKTFSNHPILLRRPRDSKPGLRRLHDRSSGKSQPTGLPPDFLHCSQKGELNLSGKHLAPSALFSMIRSYEHDLKKLDLSGCDLSYLDKSCLKRLSALEELNLSNNPLRHLDLDLEFLEHMCLKKLDLSGCGVTYQHLAVQKYLRGLEDLNLSNNPLHTIKLFSSKSMPGLRTLDISGCGLTDKDLKDFALWDEVEELNLSNNPLSHMLQYPKNLKKLNLSGCCFTKWPSGLGKCSSLEELDLSNNFFGHQLKNLPPSVLRLSNLNRIMFADVVYTKNDKG